MIPPEKQVPSPAKKKERPARDDRLEKARKIAEQHGYVLVKRHTWDALQEKLDYRKHRSQHSIRYRSDLRRLKHGDAKIIRIERGRFPKHYTPRDVAHALTCSAWWEEMRVSVTVDTQYAYVTQKETL